MIFSSPIFILIFLPLVLISFWSAIYLKFEKISKLIIIIFSIIFYSWWDLSYVPLILLTIIFNFLIGNNIYFMKKRGLNTNLHLIIGIIFNLIPLVYFKYSSFLTAQILFIDNSFASKFEFLLPLGISFYTFQQISYLIDISRGLTSEKSLINFGFFILFFPQLIAGPIVRFKEIRSQIEYKYRKFNFLEDIAIGFTIFTNGLFKKIVLADSFANYVNPTFELAASNQVITSSAAWIAAISYFFQLYFDFSGYSDMAIGISRCFAIKLPINFNSPYKSYTVSEFWRNWHITLTRFIRNYIFPVIALPITRNISKVFKSKKNIVSFSTFFSTLCLFAIIGFWHGAGWTFILFGVIHGTIVAFESIFFKFKKNYSNNLKNNLFRRFYVAIIVILAFVIFRAPDLNTAFNFLKFMFNVNFTNIEFNSYFLKWVFITLFGFFIVYFLPNQYQMTKKYNGALISDDSVNLNLLKNKLFIWQPNLIWAMYISLIFIISLSFMSIGVVEFIYFDF